jgi:hypothetical protein
MPLTGDSRLVIYQIIRKSHWLGLCFLPFARCLVRSVHCDVLRVPTATGCPRLDGSGAVAAMRRSVAEAFFAASSEAT